MKIKFCGAATSVTGSCHFVDTGKYKFLLDCGMFQGNRELEKFNASPFPFDPRELDFMFLSHAHVDHSGRIPLLVKRGFDGPIYCTDATSDLVAIMLRDSAHIQEKETEALNKKNQRLSRPLVEPIYTMEDAEAAIPLLTPVVYGQTLHINEDIVINFHDAGHILGSAILELNIVDRTRVPSGEPIKLVFSGDLGVKDRPILRDPTFLTQADYVIMETTYGNRVHTPTESSVDELMDICMRTIRRGGNVIIPAFSVGRTQELIFMFHQFYMNHKEFRKEMAATQVYIDSPMATAATDVFRKNAHVFDDEMREYLLKGYNPLDFANLHFTQSVAESQQLNTDKTPKVIISASGMCEAGRIKHHLKHNIWDSRNSVIIVGYQAEGTLGRNIIRGDKVIHIFGEPISVNAEIYNLQGFSGHADKNGLLEWLGSFTKAPEMTFLVHGEPESRQAFAYTVKEKLGFPVEIVRGHGAEYDIHSLAVTEPADGKTRVTNISSAQAMDQSEKMHQFIDLKEKLSDVHNELEDILYHAQLATDDDISTERLEMLTNLLIELEKNTMNLGSAVSLEDKPTVEQSAPAAN